MTQIATKQLGKIGCAGCAMGARRHYNISKTAITSGTLQVPIGDNVNGFVVKNSGNTIVMFNREPLQPGESQTVGGNEGEIYVGRVDIFFVLPIPAPAVPIDSCWITVKYYPK
jgi:hypothetical protein